MINDEKIRILKYFLLAEGLNPKVIDKKTPLDIVSNKVVFNTKNSRFGDEILNAEQRLIIPPKNICSLAIFGSLYPINNIQNKLNRFAKAFTPNATMGLGASFVLSFEKIEFLNKSFVFDAIHKNVNLALSPLIASHIHENSDFNELYSMCSVEFLQTLIDDFIGQVQKEFLSKRFDYDNDDDNNDKKHFYIKITSNEVEKLYQMLFCIYKEAINADESFISDEIQIQILSSQKGTKLDTLMNSFYLQSLQRQLNFIQMMSIKMF